MEVTQEQVIIEMVTMMNMVEILKLWEPMEDSPRVLYASKKDKTLDWIGYGDDAEPVSIPRALEMMREWVWDQYKTWGIMYLYICPDNAIVSCDDGPYDKDHLKSVDMCSVPIRVKDGTGRYNIYYQGWD